jgi:hypothetical protein
MSKLSVNDLPGGKAALIRAIQQVDLQRAALYQTFPSPPLEPEEPEEEPIAEPIEDTPEGPSNRQTNAGSAAIDLTRDDSMAATDNEEDDEDFEPTGSRATKTARSTQPKKTGRPQRSGIHRKVALQEHATELIEQQRQLTIEVYLFNNQKHTKGDKQPWDFLFVVQQPVHATRSPAHLCQAVLADCLERGTIQDEPSNAHKAELVLLNAELTRWTMPYVKEFDDFLKDWYENEDKWVEPKTRVKVMMAPSKLWLKQQQMRRKSIPTQEACSVLP